MTRKYLTGQSVWGSPEEGDKSLLESEDPSTGINILESTSQR